MARCPCCACETEEDCYACLPGDTQETLSDGSITCCRTSELVVSDDSPQCDFNYLGIIVLDGVETCGVEYFNCPAGLEYLEGINFLPGGALQGLCCANKCCDDVLNEKCCDGECTALEFFEECPP